MNTIIKGAALLAFIVSPAFAQSAGSQNQSGTNLQNQSGTASQIQSGSQSSMDSDGLAAAQKIKQDLENAGFTNVQIMAESFVVQAKSKNGDPVLMTIGPHGMSLFEAMETNGGSSGTSPGTSGSASSTTGMNNNTGTDSTTGSVDSQANSKNSTGTGASTSPSTNDTSTDQNNRR
jgi:hypothetical protein